MLAVCAAQSSSRRPHRRDRTRLVAVTDKSECGRLLAVAFRRRWSGFGQIGSTFGGVGNGLREGAARSQRNLPAPSQLARPANAQPRIRVPTAALGRAMRPNVSYDCNHSFRQKVRPSWRAQWPVPARRADQGRDCGAAEIQCIAEDAPRWPNIKYVERGLGSAALLNM